MKDLVTLLISQFYQVYRSTAGLKGNTFTRLVGLRKTEFLRMSEMTIILPATFTKSIKEVQVYVKKDSERCNTRTT